MLVAPLPYEKLSVVCADQPLGRGSPKSPEDVKAPWKDTEDVAPLPLPLEANGRVTGAEEVRVCEPPGHEEGVVSVAFAIVKPLLETEPEPIEAL